MSLEESSDAKEPAPETENAISRMASLPLVSSTYDMVSAAYASSKETHPYLKTICDVAEKGVKTLATAAANGAQPLLTTLEPQIAAANEYACKGLDKLEEKLPILQQPSEKVVADTKDLVSTKVTGAQGLVSSTINGAVTGAVGMAKGAVHGGMEATRSVVAGSIHAVLGSRVGQMVATGIDVLLGKSEELVDHYLPMTDQELAALATSVEGFEMATVEQQKAQGSYFVRLGSLSAKLRHRAYQHSLAKLRDAKQGTQDALGKLHQTVELIEHLKQGVDQKVQGSQERLHQMYLEWNQKPSEDPLETPLAPPEVESQTLAMFHGLTQQLMLSCSTLTSRVQGLPASVQDRIHLLRNTVEDLHASFSGLRSFQEVPNALLAQSRERIASARASVDEMVDYVAQNVPLPWVVGPFAPNLVELPEIPSSGSEKVEGGLQIQKEPTEKTDRPQEEPSDPKAAS